MKRFIILFMATLAFIFSHAKAGGNWTGLYTLDEGTSVTRTSAVIQVQKKEFYKNSPKEIYLPKGTQMSGRVIKQPVLFTIDMDQIQFRKEVLKLGNIKYSLIYPQEKPTPVIKKLLPLPKKNLVRAGKKAALVKKKRPARVVKAPTRVIQKLTPPPQKNPVRAGKKAALVKKKRPTRVTQKRPVRVTQKKGRK